METDAEGDFVPQTEDFLVDSSGAPLPVPPGTMDRQENQQENMSDHTDSRDSASLAQSSTVVFVVPDEGTPAAGECLSLEGD